LDNSVYINMTSGKFNVNGKTDTIYWFTNSGGTYVAPRGSALTVIDPDWYGGTNDILGNDVLRKPHHKWRHQHHPRRRRLRLWRRHDHGGWHHPDLQFYGTASPNLTLSSDDVSSGKLILAGNVGFTGASGTASITNGNKLQDNLDGTWTDHGSLGSNDGQDWCSMAPPAPSRSRTAPPPPT